MTMPAACLRNPPHLPLPIRPAAVHAPDQRLPTTKEESGQGAYQHSLLACVHLGDAVAVRVTQTIRRGSRLPEMQRLRNLREVGIHKQARPGNHAETRKEQPKLHRAQRLCKVELNRCRPAARNALHLRALLAAGQG